MGVPYKTSLSLVAAVANGVAQAQTPAAAASLTLNGSLVTAGVAKFDNARRVGIASSGNDSALLWTVTGTDRYGNPLTERLTGANAGVAQTQGDFLSVSRVASSGAAAGPVTVGTTTVGSTPWWTLDFFREGISVGVGVVINGTVNATVEYTFDDPNANQAGTFAPASNVPPLPWPHVSLNGITANGSAAINLPVVAVRLTVNSGTGTATMQLLQSGTHL